MLSPLLYWAVLLGIVAFAFIRGHVDERIAALTCLGGTVATVVVSGAGVAQYASVETGVLIVDLVAFVVFVGIALKSSRFWPLWVAGFQLSSALAHFLRALQTGLIPQAYAAAERFWIYPIFLCILVGVWRAPRYAQPGSAA